MDNFRNKIIVNKIVGWAILGVLLTPVIGITGQWLLDKIDPVAQFPLSISFAIAVTIGGLTGYFFGKRAYKKYEQNPTPEFVEKLPQINWKLVGATLITVGLIAQIILVVTNQPDCFEMECLLMGLAFFIWALMGAVASIFLAFLINLIPGLKARGLRNIGLIFVLSFIFLVVIFNLNYLIR